MDALGVPCRIVNEAARHRRKGLIKGHFCLRRLALAAAPLLINTLPASRLLWLNPASCSVINWGNRSFMTRLATRPRTRNRLVLSMLFIKFLS